jgi:hypothetical protein
MPLFQLVLGRRIGINVVVSQESLKYQKVIVADEIAHAGVLRSRIQESLPQRASAVGGSLVPDA